MNGKDLARTTLSAGLAPLSHLYNRLRPGIRILMYHRVADLPAYDQLTVSPRRFEEHMAWLAAHQRVISLDTAVTELDTALATGEDLRPGVVITFDDGYLDNLTHALPVLERHRLPASIFVTTAFAEQAMSHPRYPAVEGRLHLTWEEIRQMAANPLITIGSHTLTHPFLGRLSGEESAREIAQSRAVIQEKIAAPVNYFCYPSGDYGARETGLVSDAGYRAAVTVSPGSNRAGTPRFALRRTEVTDRDSPRELAKKLAGGFDLIHLLLDLRRRRHFARAARLAQEKGN